MGPNFTLINKPAGWTSFDAVNYVRKTIRKTHPDQKNIKVGHAGTLDPFATGLLIVGIGREATKKLDEFKKLRKTYVATIKLGATSDTQDVTGIITSQTVTEQPTQKTVEQILQNFVGVQNQIPPMHSAKQVSGVRLYKLAREGKTVERAPSSIEIYNIKLLDYSYPLVILEIQCSTGTYVRTLAEDIGVKLGTGAYCHALERTSIGKYTLAEAQTPDQFKAF
jgi:tRNA pseudouridine55 synthase